MHVICGTTPTGWTHEGTKEFPSNLLNNNDYEKFINVYKEKTT
jgi:hypothetical protein